MHGVQLTVSHVCYNSVRTASLTGLLVMDLGLLLPRPAKSYIHGHNRLAIHTLSMTSFMCREP